MKRLTNNQRSEIAQAIRDWYTARLKDGKWPRDKYETPNMPQTLNNIEEIIKK